MDGSCLEKLTGLPLLILHVVNSRSSSFTLLAVQRTQFFKINQQRCAEGIPTLPSFLPVCFCLRIESPICDEIWLKRKKKAQSTSLILIKTFHREMLNSLRAKKS